VYLLQFSRIKVEPAECQPSLFRRGGSFEKLLVPVDRSSVASGCSFVHSHSLFHLVNNATLGAPVSVLILVAANLVGYLLAYRLVVVTLHFTGLMLDLQYQKGLEALLTGRLCRLYR